MRRARKTTSLGVRAANDNAPVRRKISVDFPADFPITQIELEIVETWLSAMISELSDWADFRAANDNEAGSPERK